MSWHRALAGKIRELRLVCCQTSPHSEGIRSFISKNYSQVKDQAPGFPFIVRECENAIPLVVARYDFGVEKKVCVEGFSENTILEQGDQRAAEEDAFASPVFQKAGQVVGAASAGRQDQRHGKCQRPTGDPVSHG